MLNANIRDEITIDDPLYLEARHVESYFSSELKLYWTERRKLIAKIIDIFSVSLEFLRADVIKALGDEANPRSISRAIHEMAELGMIKQLEKNVAVSGGGARWRIQPPSHWSRETN